MVNKDDPVIIMGGIILTSESHFDHVVDYSLFKINCFVHNVCVCGSHTCPVSWAATNAEEKPSSMTRTQL